MLVEGRSEQQRLESHSVLFMSTDYSPECGEEPDSVSVYGHSRANYTIFTPSSLGNGHSKHEVLLTLVSVPCQA